MHRSEDGNFEDILPPTHQRETAQSKTTSLALVDSFPSSRQWRLFQACSTSAMLTIVIQFAPKLIRRKCIYGKKNLRALLYSPAFSSQQTSVVHACTFATVFILSKLKLTQSSAKVITLACETWGGNQNFIRMTL